MCIASRSCCEQSRSLLYGVLDGCGGGDAVRSTTTCLAAAADAGEEPQDTASYDVDVRSPWPRVLVIGMGNCHLRDRPRFCVYDEWRRGCAANETRGDRTKRRHEERCARAGIRPSRNWNALPLRLPHARFLHVVMAGVALSEIRAVRVGKITTEARDTVVAVRCGTGRAPSRIGREEIGTCHLQPAGDDDVHDVVCVLLFAGHSHRYWHLRGEPRLCCATMEDETARDDGNHGACIYCFAVYDLQSHSQIWRLWLHDDDDGSANAHGYHFRAELLAQSLDPAVDVGTCRLLSALPQGESLAQSCR